MIPQMSRRGKFITFEGLDGTGKSTQLRKLGAVVRAAGLKVVETREPGGTLTGEKIRKVLLDSSTAGLSPLAEMALMFASRAQHIAGDHRAGARCGQCRTLRSALRIRRRLIRDMGGGWGARRCGSYIACCAANLQPDLTILLDSDAGTSVSRARRRNKRNSKDAKSGHGDENRFEQETRAFFARVHEGYLAIAKREQGRVVMIDARGTPGQTHARIADLVRRKLKV